MTKRTKAKPKESNCAALLRQFRADFKKAIDSDDPINGADAVEYIIAFYFLAGRALTGGTSDYRDKQKGTK